MRTCLLIFVVNGPGQEQMHYATSADGYNYRNLSFANFIFLNLMQEEEKCILRQARNPVLIKIFTRKLPFNGKITLSDQSESEILPFRDSRINRKFSLWIAI